MAEQAGVLTANFVASVAVISGNKLVLQTFPYAAALTVVHYAVCWAGVRWLRREQLFEPKAVKRQHFAHFVALMVTWSTCNVLSNVSLERNSVGFYQMMKLLTTPTVVVVNFVAYGERVSFAQLVALLATCIGVGLATVSDVQFNWSGALWAALSVALAVAQKLLNAHLQQRCGLSTLQVMDTAFPIMTAIAVLCVPAIDSLSGVLAAGQRLSSSRAALVLLSALAAFAATWSATRIFGLIGALAHVLLGSFKTCVVLLVGVLAFDARPNAQGVFGAALGVGSIAVYTFLSVRTERSGQLAVAPASASAPDEMRPLTSTAERSLG